MAKDDSLGSLFGKAKRWAQNEMKNAVSFADPVKQRDAEQANERLEREIESDAKQMRDAAIADALTPQSIKDYRAMTAANRAASEAAADAKARAERVTRVNGSSFEMSGYISGRVDGVAVETWTLDESNDLAVSVECVDPAPLQGGTVRGFCFTIPDYHGDGSYPLVDEDLDSLQYELYIVEESEGWGFHPSHGPGVIDVTGDVADVHLTLGSAGTETIELHATIFLK